MCGITWKAIRVRSMTALGVASCVGRCSFDFGLFREKMNQSKHIFDETWGGKQQKLYFFVFPKEVPFNNPLHQYIQYVLKMPLTWKAPN